MASSCAAMGISLLLSRLCHTFSQDGPLDANKAAEVAEAFVIAAARNSVNPKFRSPWVTEAAKAGVLPIWKRLDPVVRRFMCRPSFLVTYSLPAAFLCTVLFVSYLRMCLVSGLC